MNKDVINPRLAWVRSPNQQLSCHAKQILHWVFVHSGATALAKKEQEHLEINKMLSACKEVNNFEN